MVDKGTSSIRLLKSHKSIERKQIRVTNFNRGKQKKTRNTKVPYSSLGTDYLRKNGRLNLVLWQVKPTANMAMLQKYRSNDIFTCQKFNSNTLITKKKKTLFELSFKNS